MADGVTTDVTRGVGGGRILVVDDDPMIRETIGQVLQKEGYVVDLAVDGAPALTCFYAAQPDAILLVWGMSVMGAQFLRALRRAAAYAGVPVGIMTAVPESGDNLSTLGASETVDKPINVGNLLRTVARLLHASREPNRGPTQPMSPVVAPSESPPQNERGILILVDRDLSDLKRLDTILSARGFTVIARRRAPIRQVRQVCALRPCAILLAWEAGGIDDFVRKLDDTTYTGDVDAQIEVLVFSRTGGTHPAGTLEHATDADLVDFVESRHDHQEVREIDATELRLLAAIAQRDDASRIVYADWLEERGEAARVEFLRAQELLAVTAVNDPLFRERSERLRELGAAVDVGWRYKVARRQIENYRAVGFEIVLRGFLERILGWRADRTEVVDRALRSVRLAAMQRGALVLCGAGDLVPIARSLHRRVIGADRPFIVFDPRRAPFAEHPTPGMSALREATGGSLCVRSLGLPRDWSEVVISLQDPTSQVQLVVCQQSGKRGRTVPGVPITAPITVPPLASRPDEIDQIIEEYADDAMRELRTPHTCFLSEDREWVRMHSALSLPDIEKGTRQRVALRESDNRRSEAARLRMAPLGLSRWFGRRKPTC